MAEHSKLYVAGAKNYGSIWRINDKGRAFVDITTGGVEVVIDAKGIYVGHTSGVFHRSSGDSCGVGPHIHTIVCAIGFVLDQDTSVGCLHIGCVNEIETTGGGQRGTYAIAYAVDLIVSYGTGCGISQGTCGGCQHSFVIGNGCAGQVINIGLCGSILILYWVGEIIDIVIVGIDIARYGKGTSAAKGPELTASSDIGINTGAREITSIDIGRTGDIGSGGDSDCCVRCQIVCYIGIAVGTTS